MLTTLFILAIIGLAIATYAYATELKIKKDPSFKAACDISDKISCTKPMLSEYSHIFFLPNNLVLMIYYAVIALFAAFNLTQLMFWSAIVGVIGSLFFAYLLFFKIRSICVLCISLYVVNALLFLYAYRAFMG